MDITDEGAAPGGADEGASGRSASASRRPSATDDEIAEMSSTPSSCKATVAEEERSDSAMSTYSTSSLLLPQTPPISVYSQDNEIDMLPSPASPDPEERPSPAISPEIVVPPIIHFRQEDHVNIEHDPVADMDDEMAVVSMPSVPNYTKVDLLLFKSVETFAAVQRTTAVPQLRCECSERNQCLRYVGMPPYRKKIIQVYVEGFVPRLENELLSNLLVGCLSRYLPTRAWREVLGVRALVERPMSMARNLSSVLWPSARQLNDYRAPLAAGPSHEDDEETVDDDEDSSPEDIIAPIRPIVRSSFNFNFNFPPFCEEETPPPALEATISRRRYDCTRNMPQPSLAAQQVANRVIKFARFARNIHEDDMCCLNCGFLPISPRTGTCGHTRCSKCIENMAQCPCGRNPTLELPVNIVIRDLLEKTPDFDNIRIPKGIYLDAPRRAVPPNKLLNGSRASSSGLRPAKRMKLSYPVVLSRPLQYNIPMSSRARFAYAVELLHSGRHREAAPHLALAAASNHSDLQVARTLLAQVVMVLSNKRDPRVLTRELNYFVRHMTTISWIKPKDIECVLCCDVFTNAVTTPCGHMYCRTCLEKTLDYWMRCPLCFYELTEFNLAETGDTMFMKGALIAINAFIAPKSQEEEDVVPIFVCTVAYPSVPCPLFIFDPRYWLMIRRVLDSDSRRFGMVAMDREKKYASFGTVLEVRDCVRLEDGRSIVSTMGVSRFKVIERCVRDGCEVARIEQISDIRPVDDVIIGDLKMYATQTLLKAVMWLSRLDARMLADIESAFGAMPSYHQEQNWWLSADGPTWVWWLVAVLPLRTEIKTLILSTQCLLKRLMAVSRTLDAVAGVRLTTLAPGQCLSVSMPSSYR